MSEKCQLCEKAPVSRIGFCDPCLLALLSMGGDAALLREAVASVRLSMNGPQTICAGQSPGKEERGE